MLWQLQPAICFRVNLASVVRRAHGAASAPGYCRQIVKMSAQAGEAAAASSTPHGNNKVAVVGAGVSGLTCAAALAKNGFDVLVIETGRGPGGRTSTRRGPDDSGWQWDHGAQYLTAKTPEVGTVA